DVLGSGLLSTELTAAAAAQEQWINSNGGDWNDAANWSTGRVPAAGDDVIINLAAGRVITVGTNATIGSLVVQGGGTLLVTGGLTVSGGAVQIADNLVVNGGRFVTNGAVTAGNVLIGSDGSSG